MEWIQQWLADAILDEAGVYAVLAWLFWDRVRGATITTMQERVLADIHQELGGIKTLLTNLTSSSRATKGTTPGESLSSDTQN